MATLVMKFGGSLTADARRLARVAQVIMAESLAWKKMVVVVSAMAGTTDALDRCVDLAAARDASGYRRIVAKLRSDHVGLIQTLFESESQQHDLIGKVDRLLFDVINTCDGVAAKREALPRDHDKAMAAGERMMIQILTALVRREGLNAIAVDATSLVVTDEHHQGATPLLDLIDERVEQIIHPLLEEGIVPLITGFIGASRTGALTTLGRGGSDFTATILAASRHDKEVWIWATGAGIMAAEPDLH